MAAHVLEGGSGRRSAFTLIELLVVIAIIALLVSILVPSLNQARDLAKTAVCLANQKQVGTAVVEYTAEYNGVIYGPQPPGTYDMDGKHWVILLLDMMNSSQPFTTWRHITNADCDDGVGEHNPAPYGSIEEAKARYTDYKRMARMFFCPAAPMTNRIVLASENWAGMGANALEAESCIYGAPVFTWGHYFKNRTSWYAGACDLSRLRKAGESVLAVEAAYNLWPSIDGDSLMANMYGTSASWLTEFSRFDHGKGRINFLFFDGHAAGDVTAPYSLSSGGYAAFVD